MRPGADQGAQAASSAQGTQVNQMHDLFMVSNVPVGCLLACFGFGFALMVRLSAGGNENPAIADGDDECYVGRCGML